MGEVTVNGKPLSEIESKFKDADFETDRCKAMKAWRQKRMPKTIETGIVGSGRLLQRSPRNCKHTGGIYAGVKIR